MDEVEYLDTTSILGCNLYTYCVNNPIAYFDVEGHSAIFTFFVYLICCCVVITLVGILYDTIVNLIDDLKKNILQIWNKFKNNMIRLVRNIKKMLKKINKWVDDNIEFNVYFDPTKQTYRNLSQFGIKKASELVYNEFEPDLKESKPTNQYINGAADFSELHYI